MNFITIDFETANANYNSACQIGIAEVENGIIVREYSSLIKPPSDFHHKNIEITGIRPEDVKDSPQFVDIWNDIQSFFQNNHFVVAHNAYFDMCVLRASLEDCKIIPPNFNYLCSINICSTLGDLRDERKTLSNLAELCGYSFKHHDALEDAKACAYIVNKFLEKNKIKSLEEACIKYNSLKINPFLSLAAPSGPAFFSKENHKKFNYVKPSEIKPTVKNFDKKHPFYNKIFVFTGELEYYSRAEAYQEIVDRGGIVRGSVSGNTNFLIVGKQDKKIVGSSGISTKEKKAQELKEKGVNIYIFREKQFKDLLDFNFSEVSS